MDWLYEAKKRYRLTVLNYIVTSNHIHLLVSDDGTEDTIASSMQLLAGRTGQEYNQRKNRRGAYWEDRYHATAVEKGNHLVVVNTLEKLGIKAKGREAVETEGSFQLKEPVISYKPVFAHENTDLRPKNTYFLDDIL